MEAGIVTIHVYEYNQLRDFKREVLKGNKIVVTHLNGLYGSDKEIEYYTEDKIAKEISTELGKRIDDLENIIVVLKDVAGQAEYIHTMSYWELFKWRLKH